MAPDRDSAGRLLVLIPAYNEEEHLADVIAGVRQAVEDAEIVVIDDCSRDRTSAVAQAAGASLLRHPVNLGYGAALLTGYRFAEQVDATAVVQIDGDGQHDPAAIPRMVELLKEGHDLVLGSRFREGSRRYRAQRMRAVGIRLFARIASRALDQKITDPTSGYQALSRELVRFHTRGNHFPQDYPDADILILVGRAGFRITEIGVTMFEKPGGASIHSGIKPLYYVVKMILSIVLVLSGARGVLGKDLR